MRSLLSSSGRTSEVFTRGTTLGQERDKSKTAVWNHARSTVYELSSEDFKELGTGGAS